MSLQCFSRLAAFVRMSAGFSVVPTFRTVGCDGWVLATEATSGMLARVADVSVLGGMRKLLPPQCL